MSVVKSQMKYEKIHTLPSMSLMASIADLGFVNVTKP